MKNAVVLVLILVVGVYGPQQSLHSRYDALWAMGALVLAAYILQRAAERVRLPGIVGWIGAGLLLGSSGLRLAGSQDLAALHLVRTLAALWVGFQVGIHFWWPKGFGWRGSALVGSATLVALAAITAGIWALSGVPLGMALLLAGLGSLWGLFTLQPNPARRGALMLAAVGSGFSLVLLLGVLALLWGNGLVPVGGLHLGLRLAISPFAGALGALACRRLGLFEARNQALTAGLFAAFFVSALLISHWHLVALPFGFGAGVALVRQPLPARRLRFFLRSLSPVAFATYFALMGATLELGVLRQPLPDLWVVLLVEVVVLVTVRVLGPALWYPSGLPSAGARRHLGWLLLPKGALLFELLYHPVDGLAELLEGERGLLLHQAALGDILIFALVFASVAVAIPHRWLDLRPAHAPA
ncbi:MAG: hypothetical protein WDA75_01225 [Candidatus Latescibacterota bacterium]|jgi:hypothetical protein